MKNILIIFCFTLAFSSFGQDLTNYKYVVVPEKFSFLKDADQYQLNSLTQFLFEKYGFQAYIEGEEEFVRLNPDRCEGLYADVLSDSGMFRTRLNVILKDCRNRQVFTSQEGLSREKDFKTAYQEALRMAFESIEAFNNSNREVIVSSIPNLNVQTEVNQNQTEMKNSSEAVEVKNRVEDLTESDKESRSLKEISASSTQSSSLNLKRDGSNFLLQKSEKGFNLFHKGTTEPFATLIRSSVGNSFIYNSITSKGIACLDNEGNLIIEVLKDDGNSLETIVYRAGDQ